ncbi:MAG: IS1595 family transposase [Bacteroidota bacterium]|nr:IS1595 family transposase [Bacteroidota bacterium]
MLNIPIEEEDSLKRLNSSKIFKERNKNFGTRKRVKEVFSSDDEILKKIFDARAAKTLGGCPHCERPFSLFKKIPKKLAFKCKCPYKIHPLKGTHYEQSRTPLTETVELIYELFRNKHGVPATALQRADGGDYDTCLYNLHRASDWMGWSLEGQKFTPGSTIEFDEVYPKAETGLGEYYKFKRGKGSERTHGILVMTERDDPEKGIKGITKAFHFDKTNSKEVEALIKKYVRPEDKHKICTDESDYYTFLSYNGYLHHTINHGNKEYINKETGCSTNTVEGCNERVKTTIHRVYLGVHPEYLQFYINRVAFNHSCRAKNFFEVMDVLFNSLPDFYNCVVRKAKRKSRKRKKKEQYRPAA